jgi:deoxyribodipyrimidine photo-lyase
MKEKLVLYWSRRDFRLRDNPALAAAVLYAKTEKVHLLPLFILEDYMCAGDPSFQFGYPSRVFLSKALPPFLHNFETAALVKGKAVKTILQFTELFEVSVFVNEDVYPDFYKQIAKLRDAGVDLHILKDQLTIDRATVTGAGNKYSVFTPFKKAVWTSFTGSSEAPAVSLKDVMYAPPTVVPAEVTQVEISEKAIMDTLGSSRLLKVGETRIDIDTLQPVTPNFGEWYTTEKDAYRVFKHFLKNAISTYKESRDFLAEEGTSKMSLALAWGLTSARILKNEIQKHFAEDFSNPFSSHTDAGAIHFLSELIWREFYKYLFFHNPALMNTEFQERFRETIAWAEEREALERFTLWIQGRTGYKIVDAAMLELAHTGWMHNRARMIVASVLTKNLGVNWRWGQEYFRAMLIDLDEASNNGGWQWGASVGADPKPIRIFNPYLQAENYDKEGEYQKKWLGEDKFSSEIEPIVPHKEARAAALARYGLSEKKMGSREIFSRG